MELEPATLRAILARLTAEAIGAFCGFACANLPKGTGAGWGRGWEDVKARTRPTLGAVLPPLLGQCEGLGVMMLREAAHAWSQQPRLECECGQWVCIVDGRAWSMGVHVADD